MAARTGPASLVLRVRAVAVLCVSPGHGSSFLSPVQCASAQCRAGTGAAVSAAMGGAVDTALAEGRRCAHGQGRGSVLDRAPSDEPVARLKASSCAGDPPTAGRAQERSKRFRGRRQPDAKVAGPVAPATQPRQPRRLCRPHWARKRTMCRGRLCPFFVFNQKIESTHVQLGFADYTVVSTYRNCSREGIRSASYVCDRRFLRPVIMRFFERKIAMIFWPRVPLR